MAIKNFLPEVNDQVEVGGDDWWAVQVNGLDIFVKVSDHLIVTNVTDEFIIIEVTRNDTVLGTIRVRPTLFAKDFENLSKPWTSVESQTKITLGDKYKVNYNSSWYCKTEEDKTKTTVQVKKTDDLEVIGLNTDKKLVYFVIVRNGITLETITVHYKALNEDFTKVEVMKESKASIRKKAKIKINLLSKRPQKTFAQKKIAWNLEDPNDLYSKMDAYRLVKNFMPELFLDTELAFNFNNVTHEQLISMLQHCADEFGILYVPEDFSPFVGE